MDRCEAKSRTHHVSCHSKFTDTMPQWHGSVKPGEMPIFHPEHCSRPIHTFRPGKTWLRVLTGLGQVVPALLENPPHVIQ
jgi:hypothetical protein